MKKRHHSKIRAKALLRAVALTFVLSILASSIVDAKTHTSVSSKHSAGTSRRSTSLATTKIHSSTTHHTSPKHAPVVAAHVKGKHRSTTPEPIAHTHTHSVTHTVTHLVHGRRVTVVTHTLVKSTKYVPPVREPEQEEAPPPEPKAENIQDGATLSGVYHLYDQGVNANLAGNYELATQVLQKAANQYSSNKSGLTLEAMINYELGQAAEASHNYSLASDAYMRSLRAKPNLVEAGVRVASVMMKAGQPQLALSRARDIVAANPSDPRAHQILALVLEKNGFKDDAKVEKEKASRLLRAPSAATPTNTDVPANPNSEDVGEGQARPIPSEGQPADSDVMDQTQK